MNQPSLRKSTYVPKLTDSHNLANKIEQETPQIHKYGKHFLYYPSNISTHVVSKIHVTNTENDKKSIKEDFFFDKNTNTWILVKIANST